MSATATGVFPETAYLVDDYPYGFCCQIRYWLVWDQNRKPFLGWIWTTHVRVHNNTTTVCRQRGEGIEDDALRTAQSQAK